MDKDVAQLVEMGATVAQARAALKKYKDVMRAAERIFEGEFEDLMDDDVQSRDEGGRPSGSIVQPARIMTPQDDGSDQEDMDFDDQDVDDGDEDDYVDYDSDYDAKAAQGRAPASAVDPYAGIFFSKDRKEEVIEIEEEPELVKLKEYPEPLRLISQGQWMKGCPEGSEQTFLFGQYSELSEGVCVCPENCGYSISRKKSDFLVLYPEFTSYINHLKDIARRPCPNCKTIFCFACGEPVTPERDHLGRITIDANPLYHCAKLQGVILGVGLITLEQTFADQVATAAQKAVKQSTNAKKRKAEANAVQQSKDADDFDDLYYSNGKGKKPKGGIGYAGNMREDVSGQEEALAIQKTKDEQIGNLLGSIREFLPNLHRPEGGKTSDYLPNPTTLAHLRRRFNYVSSSLLRNDSLSDMSDRNVLYFELFEWLETISNHEALASMMAMPIMVVSSVKTVNTRKSGRSQVRERTIVYEGSSGPRELLEAIVIQAQAAIKGLEGYKLAEQEIDEMTEDQKRMRVDHSADKGKGKQTVSHEGAEENARLLDFCNRIIATAAAIDRSLRDTKGEAFLKRLKASLPKVPASVAEASAALTSAGVEGVINDSVSDEKLRSMYVDWATRVRFEYCDISVPLPEGKKIDEDYTPTYKHHFNNEARMLANSDIPRRALAIAKELAVLTTNLPVAWDSSIFLRVDESRVDIIKALITGPEGTPYYNGCYAFDIFLGPSYNQTAPNVKYMTTNGGKYRFNPNLYADGKVCLSLLGTWSGPGWVAGKSTLLQVLISIQSMILCEEPYTNEPGWQNDAGSPNSKAYSANVRRMVVNTAMLGMLKNPPEPFADVIRTHFKLKARSITKQLDDWLALDDGKGTASDGGLLTGSMLRSTPLGGSSSALKRDIAELKTLLSNLQQESIAGSSSTSSAQ